MIDFVDAWRDRQAVQATLALSVVFFLSTTILRWTLVLVVGVDVRPGGAVLVLGSVLFGPAAAWGAVIGYLASDALLGAVALDTLCWSLAAFLSSVAAYRLWSDLLPEAGADAVSRPSVRGVAAYVLVTVTSIAVLASVYAWTLDMLSLSPFSITVFGTLQDTLPFALLLSPLGYYTTHWMRRHGASRYTVFSSIPSAASRDDPRRVPVVFFISVAWCVGGFALSYLFQATGLIPIEWFSVELAPAVQTVVVSAGPRGQTLLLILGGVAFVGLLASLWR